MTDLRVGHCTCMTKTPEPKYHKHGCPVRDGIKIPRLFYYEEAENSYIPAPEKIENILNAEDSFMDDLEEVEIRFKRFDMTDQEYDELPIN